MDPILTEILKQAPAVGVLCFGIWRVYNDMMTVVLHNQEQIALLQSKLEEVSERLARLEQKQ